MWSHEGAESIRSALSTRYVMYSTVKIRLERKLNEIPEEVKSQLMVPYEAIVNLRRPIGKSTSQGPRNITTMTALICRSSCCGRKRGI